MCKYPTRTGCCFKTTCAPATIKIQTIYRSFTNYWTGIGRCINDATPLDFPAIPGSGGGHGDTDERSIPSSWVSAWFDADTHIQFKKWKRFKLWVQSSIAGDFVMNVRWDWDDSVDAETYTFTTVAASETIAEYLQSGNMSTKRAFQVEIVPDAAMKSRWRIQSLSIPYIKLPLRG